MRYLLLSYRPAGGWDDGASAVVHPGELVYATRLADPTHTQTVELRGGVPVVTDGPPAETTDLPASLRIVDVESHDRALEIAARLSCATGRIEVRPVAEDDDCPADNEG